MIKRNKVSQDSGIAKNLHFVENFDCKTDNENEKKSRNNDMSLLNGKNNLIYKGTESENDLELENEENIKIKEGHTDTEKN